MISTAATGGWVTSIGVIAYPFCGWVARNQNCPLNVRTVKLASEISPGKKILTRFLVLTKTKEPVVEEHVREVGPGNLQRTLAGVERVWRAIESGVFYPAPSVMACAGCGYREACRAWQR